MLREDVFGAGGTLLFFGFVCVAFIPFAVLCLPETKGQSLENIMPCATCTAAQPACTSAGPRS